MDKKYYFAKFMYGICFWILVITMLSLTEDISDNYIIKITLFGTISSIAFPVAEKTLEKLTPTLAKPNHWRWWAGFLSLTLSIPIGIIGLLIYYKDKQLKPKQYIVSISH